jgi:hypothetical protein
MVISLGVLHPDCVAYCFGLQTCSHGISRSVSFHRKYSDLKFKLPTYN